MNASLAEDFSRCKGLALRNGSDGKAEMTFRAKDARNPIATIWRSNSGGRYVLLFAMLLVALRVALSLSQDGLMLAGHMDAQS